MAGAAAVSQKSVALVNCCIAASEAFGVDRLFVIQACAAKAAIAKEVVVLVGIQMIYYY
jgi:hypothetical protein